MNKEKNILIVIIESVVDILAAIGKPIADNGITILSVAQIALPILMLRYDTTPEEYILTYLCCIFILSVGKRIIERMKGIQSDLPIPPRVFTRTTELGVEISDSDFEEALIYLNQLEAYMKRKGAL